MRILFCPAHYVYDPSAGSELSWAYNIVDRVASRLPASLVVTGKSKVDGKPYRVVELTPRETAVNFGLTNAFAFNTKYTVATFRELRRTRFDVVHHVLPFAIGKTYNLAALWHGTRTPFVIGPVQPPLEEPDTDVDARDLRWHAFDGGERSSMLRRGVAGRAARIASNVIAPLALAPLSSRTIARAAAIVAVNEHARKLLVESGAPHDRVTVIPPGIDTERFASTGRREESASTVDILTVSRLMKRKNVDVVLRAFSQVALSAPRVRLRIVGDGPERPALMQLGDALGLRTKVTFTGAIPNATVHDEYRRAHVFVNASASEGFATTCLEALASGLPIVSTKVGGFVDVVEHERNGYLVSSPTIDELAAALRRLVEDPALVATMSSRARQDAQRFDWDTGVVPRYIELYEHVALERAGVTSSR